MTKTVEKVQKTTMTLNEERLIQLTIVWTISICFMLFSQVFSIFLRVLCEVVTHRKTIIT